MGDGGGGATKFTALSSHRGIACDNHTNIQTAKSQWNSGKEKDGTKDSRVTPKNFWLCTWRFLSVPLPNGNWDAVFNEIPRGEKSA